MKHLPHVQEGQLEAAYSGDGAPDGAGLGPAPPDPCTVLYHHLNHPRAAAVLPPLLQAAHGIGAPAVRLLKLLVHNLFTPELYGDDVAPIARGAFAAVQSRSLVLAPGGFLGAGAPSGSGGGSGRSSAQGSGQRGADDAAPLLVAEKV